MNSASALALDSYQITRLLHLSSPALPIGGFSYSQGLEAAVELQLIHDEPTALHWIEQQLQMVIARTEAPLWCLMYQAWQAQDWPALDEWNQWFYASRESQELRQETKQMGLSLYKLVQALNWGHAPAVTQLSQLDPLTLPCVHAFVCVSARLPLEVALSAYLFTWLENQVAAAIKSVPLGQLAGQRILTQVMQHIPAIQQEAIARSAASPPQLNAFAPQYAIVASRHETQFSRLFRS